MCFIKKQGANSLPAQKIPRFGKKIFLMTERHLDSQNLINYSLYIWEEMIKFWWVLLASFLRNNFFFRKKYVENSKKRLILAIFLNKDVQEKIQNVTQTASFAYILLEMIPQAYNQLKLGFLISFSDFPFLGPVAVNYHQKLEMCLNCFLILLKILCKYVW